MYSNNQIGELILLHVCNLAETSATATCYTIHIFQCSCLYILVMILKKYIFCISKTAKEVKNNEHFCMKYF